MNEAKRKYTAKCNKRHVTFYLHEKEIYDFSKSINFSKLVKQALKSEMQKSKMIRRKQDDFVTTKELSSAFLNEFNEIVEGKAKK